MKNIFRSILVITFLLLPIHALMGQEIVPTINNNLTTDCVPWPDSAYVPADGNILHAEDNFWSPASRGKGVISKNSTIGIYTPGNKASIQGNWNQNTSYIPEGDNYRAFRSINPIIVNRSSLVSSDRGKIIMQIVYSVKSMYQGSNNTRLMNEPNSYYYTKTSDKKFVMVGNLGMSFDPQTIYTEVECHNITPRWCGDGVVDNDGKESFEQCDKGAENGKPGSGCDTSCKPVSSEPPVCASSLNGKTVSSPLTSGQCDKGTVNSFGKTMNGNTENYSWKCDLNGQSVSCSANYTPPTTEPPVCASSLNGKDLPNPITVGQCDKGTSNSFGKVMSGTTEIYSWKCDNSGKSVTCSAKYTPGKPPQGPKLEIKKYAKSKDSGDSQNSGSAVQIIPGESFSYYYVMKNTGSGVAKGAIVKDTFPRYISINQILAPSGWSCEKGSQVFGSENFERAWLVCKTDADIPAGAVLDFEVKVKVASDIPSGTPFQNIVYVCEKKLPDGKANPACTENPPPPPPPGCESLPPEERAKDPACVVVGGTSITIKKYAKSIETGDTQSAPISINPGEAFNYYYTLENTSTVDATGVMIKDTFPEHLSWNGEISIKDPSGSDVTSDWNCTKSLYGGTRIALVCLKKTALPKNSGKYIFTIPVKMADNPPNGLSMQNVVYACATNATTNPKGPNGEDICGNTNPPPPPPGGQCDKTTPEAQKDPACVVVGSGTNLTIKKYAKSKDSGDSQNAGSAVQVTPGETFNYYYVMKNEGSGPAKGAIVKDTFPRYISITNITAPSGWTCEKGMKIFDGETFERAWLVCKTDADIPAGAVLDFTIQVKVASDIPSGTPFQNVVYVCEKKLPDGKANPACTENPPPPPPPGCESLPPEERAKDPACVVVGGGFDLRVKKYITYNSNTDDAQNSPGVSMTTGATFSYVIRVTNTGPKNSSGITTVQDIIPTGVEMNGTPTGNGWSCSLSSRTVTCTTTQEIAGGANFSDITIPARVTAGSGTTILNIAVVDNPLESNRCKADGTMPSSASEFCSKDTNNSDPAYLNTGDSGNKIFYFPYCFGSTPTCAVGTFTNIEACNAIYTGACSNAYNCNTSLLNCSGNPNPYCGDGILQGGEECDLGTANSDNGMCSKSCKITKKSITNPGENPIIEMWVRIPNLSPYNLGISFTNYYFDTNPYKIVVGANTSIFTIADSVQFGLSQKYDVPLLLDVDRLFCLEADDIVVKSSGNSKATCRKIGDVATNYKTSDGKYVALGAGDYFLPTSCGNAGCTYNKYTINNKNEITLFKGSEIYPDETGGNPLTLRDRFKGSTEYGKMGGINLTSNGIDLVSIPVKIGSAFVSNTAGGTAYMRSVSITFSTDAVLKTFLDNLAKGNFTTTVVGNANVSGGVQGGTTTITNSGALLIKTNITTTAENSNLTNCTDLTTQLGSYNGNTSILLVKGKDLTLNCISPLMIAGVRTVLVQSGDLIINKNIRYTENTPSASWAFIVEKGNIIIDPSVTEIAGVFIAIPDGNTKGKIMPPSGSPATANILKVDGSLYGNANDLIQNRTYVRGNQGYNILTSGLIINYSSRAIVNPPPLLTQYLNNYSIQKVAQ